MSIADYLLKLARDADAAKRHRRSKDEGRVAMREHGLSDEQIAIIESGDSSRIAEAIRSEFVPVNEAGAFPVNIVFMITMPGDVSAPDR